MELRIHAEARPVLQFLFNVFARGFRLQAERLAAKINAVGAVRHFRNVKAFAEVSQWVASGLRRGKFLRGLELGAGHLELVQGGELTMNHHFRFCPVKILNPID